MTLNDLTQRDTHFAFGENWASFAQQVSDEQLAQAEAGMRKLLGPHLVGRSFLEIGCGSGIHALAALRLGARSVMAFDIDPRAAATARSLLERYAPNGPWTVATRSIFEVLPGSPLYDVVYSWGVLHHSGDMWNGLELAASLVRPEGHLVIALYRKTPLCHFWRAEKWLFTNGPRWYQALAESAYQALFMGGLLATGRNPVRYIRSYSSPRGMRFRTDIRDWLGGYPYESADPAQVREKLAALNFAEEIFFPCNTRIGLLGVGCDEYVFRRRP